MSKSYFSNNSSTNNNKFYTEAQKILNILKLDLTDIDNYKNYNNGVVKYNNLKLHYPIYKKSTDLNIISQLINYINFYVENIKNLNNQLTSLEQKLSDMESSNSYIYTSSYNINQNTSLKLEYVQYLLLFDINASNGVFLKSHLDIAKHLLSINNNRLQRTF